MKYITIPVDDIVYRVLASQAAEAGEPEVELYIRDVLLANTRRDQETTKLPQLVGLEYCTLDLALPGVYGVRNGKRKRAYIGSAKSIAVRITQHVHKLRLGKHHNIDLQADWIQDGEGTFEWFVIDFLPEASREHLLQREYMWIDRIWKLKGYSSLYNQRIEYNRIPSWNKEIPGRDEPSFGQSKM